LVWQIVTIAGVWIYAVISGTQPPSVRAAIVVTAAVLAFRIGRRPDFVTLILLAAAAMVVIEPHQIGSLGFQLSVAASLALAIVVPSLIGSGRLGRVTVLIAAAVTAQLATVPFLLPAFGTVSLTTVLANAVVAPLVAMAMPLAAAAGAVGLVFPSLGEIVAAPAILVAEVTLKAIDELGGASASVEVGSPPRAVAVAIAANAACVVCLLSSGGERLVERLPNAMARAQRTMPSPSRPEILDGSERELALPVPTTARIVAWEDPAHALGADANHAVHEPAGQEEAHQVAHEGQCAETIP
jgi:ComEC/Rec2-related protein